MQKKLIKKVIAGAAAVAMMMSMTVMSFADVDNSAVKDPVTGTGTGSFEGSVDEDVIAVVLPTAGDATNAALAYKLDPEGLINKTLTENSYDDELTFDPNATVYFKNSDGEYDYSAKSDALKVTNKGTVAVDVTAKAQVGSVTGLNYSMATSKDSVATTSNAEVYLGLYVDGVSSADAAIPETVIGTTEKSVTVGLSGNPDNYEVVYETGASGSEYKFNIKEDIADTAWNSVGFGLTGACAKKADWSDVEDVADVTVTWSYAKRADGSQATLLKGNAATGPQVTVNEESALITISGLTSEKNYSETYLGDGTNRYKLDGDQNAVWDTSAWDKETGGTLKVTLNDSWIAFLKDKEGKVEVNFSDGTSTTVTTNF